MYIKYHMPLNKSRSVSFIFMTRMIITVNDYNYTKHRDFYMPRSRMSRAHVLIVCNHCHLQTEVGAFIPKTIGAFNIFLLGDKLHVFNFFFFKNIS